MWWGEQAETDRYRQTDRQTGRRVWQRKSRAAVVIQKGHILTNLFFACSTCNICHITPTKRMEGNQLTTKNSLPLNHLRQDHVGHLQTRLLSEFRTEDNSVLNLKGSQKVIFL